MRIICKISGMNSDEWQWQSFLGKNWSNSIEVKCECFEKNGRKSEINFEKLKLAEKIRYVVRSHSKYHIIPDLNWTSSATFTARFAVWWVLMPISVAAISSEESYMTAVVPNDWRNHEFLWTNYCLRYCLWTRKRHLRASNKIYKLLRKTPKKCIATGQMSIQQFPCSLRNVNQAEHKTESHEEEIRRREILNLKDQPTLLLQ